MAEENAPEGMEDAEALEEALSGDAEAEGTEGEELDPLAEEMLKMMEEEEGEGEGSGGQEDVDQMMEMEMLKAMEGEGGAAGGEVGGTGGTGVATAGGVPPNIARLMDVQLTVTIELGRTRKTIEEVMDLGEQSLVELEKAVGEPVDVMVNGRLFARGEVVTVQENFGVRITELLTPVGQL